MNDNLFSFVIVIGSFAFFIVCPRMAAMTNLISKNFTFSIYWLVIFGTILSIPLLLMMTWVIRQWGLMAGLGFAVFTDFLAALTISSVSMKAAVETFIIAIFVIAGNRIATWITTKIF
jgi:hypothetical protein